MPHRASPAANARVGDKSSVGGESVGRVMQRWNGGGWSWRISRACSGEC